MNASWTAPAGPAAVTASATDCARLPVATSRGGADHHRSPAKRGLECPVPALALRVVQLQRVLDPQPQGHGDAPLRVRLSHAPSAPVPGDSDEEGGARDEAQGDVLVVEEEEHLRLGAPEFAQGLLARPRSPDPLPLAVARPVAVVPPEDGLIEVGLAHEVLRVAQRAGEPLGHEDVTVAEGHPVPGEGVQHVGVQVHRICGRAQEEEVAARVQEPVVGPEQAVLPQALVGKPPQHDADCARAGGK
mmetsp:Transcript_203/g.579  ORF Transcript_203/g.579 Transcript_203/m.579 type:complete len:246 (+) Transcript_203:92-829(+)